MSEEITLPTVTDTLVQNAASRLVGVSPCFHSGISKGMLADTKIVLEYAKAVYENWINSKVQKAGDTLYFDTR